MVRCGCRQPVLTLCRSKPDKLEKPEWARPTAMLKERSAVGHLHDVCFGLHHIGNVDISQTQQSVVVPCLYRLAVHFVLPALILARSHSVASPIHRRYQTYERSFTPQPRPFPSKSQAMLLIVITMSAWMYYPRAK
ncbi:hypothetical protein, variant [Exophiala mesophila]|uniref:Uncharacterized protein n=1 Tax=Exophiala mesophila TaxID=212818 RepID=A0A0D1Y6C4_EXOME|nr:hypothetical protein, variant [Exophiala mesophila]KIV96236.1 hypothetical protein, variant [Exophiala mesophila]